MEIAEGRRASVVRQAGPAKDSVGEDRAEEVPHNRDGTVEGAGSIAWWGLSTRSFASRSERKVGKGRRGLALDDVEAGTALGTSGDAV
jgi:hypothetical protein